MDMNMKTLLYALLAGLLLVGCENEEYLYRDISSRIWLGETYRSGNLIITRDSTTLSFMMLDITIAEDTLYVTANVTGDKADYPRPFVLEVVEDETNVPASAYVMGETVMPAGAFSVRVPVLVKKNIPGLNLKTTMARLSLHFVPNEHFLPAVPDTDVFKVLWSDYLTKPDSWTSFIEGQLGLFSQARYKFIIDNTGETDFSRYQSNLPMTQALQSYLRKTLAAYNAEHEEPYLDDDETPLTF
jgi:hypothetical protein